MEEEGFITAYEAAEARSTDLEVSLRRRGVQIRDASYFVEQVRRELEARRELVEQLDHGVGEEQEHGRPLVLACAEISRRFGTSRPNFEMLSLGHIDVDSADVWTDRWLFSSSRSATEVFECAHVEVGSKIRCARGPSPPL